ncbi:MAG: M1 family metallopeptidase [Christensenellales bacterium]
MEKGKIHLKKTALIIMALLIFVSGCGAGKSYNEPKEVTEHYLSAAVDAAAGTVQCMQTINYINTAGAVLDELKFYVYANAYGNPVTTPFGKDSFADTYPDGFSRGYATIQSVKVDEKDMPFTLGGTGNIILTIPAVGLQPDERTKLEVTYTLTVPQALSRFGQNDYGMNLCNCFLVPCMFEDGEWDCNPYYDQGDPFYSQVATYHVQLQLPAGYNAAFSGYAVAKEQTDSGTTYMIDAPLVRDFACSVSDQYEEKTESESDVLIRSLAYTKENAKQSLEYAKQALRNYEDMYGEYPYAQVTVAETDFFCGGMEYPNLVLIDNSLYEDGGELILEYVIAHELAHQWWYGLVGSDQVEEPWLDEALTEYSTCLYFSRQYGAEMGDVVYKGFVTEPFTKYLEYMIIRGNEGVGRSLDTFSDSMVYTAVVYTKGALMFKALHEDMGNDFTKALQAYCAENAYGIGTPEKLLKAFGETTGKDYSELMARWLFDGGITP